MKKLLLVIFSVLLFMVHLALTQDNLYHEPYRSQVHYSPPCQWMNDPNGMVYYEGEYHLFYQYNPADVVWGPMHWGHAVSTDLIHWQTLPIALYPDELGTIWSGTVVVDAENTSGLVPGGGLVALFSYDNQTQGAAYSIDKGRTWQKYADNPVLPALETDFRDPKVFWHDDTQHWMMVIAARRVIKIFTSTNLLDWEFASDFADVNFAGGVWEVPDLFPLDINGTQKWVMIVSINPGGAAGGSGTRYYIGDFDGQTFTSDYPHDTTWLDYGPDNYAGTTWNNAPDNRRLFIGWMNNWQYAASIPTSVWRGAMTVVRQFSLRETPAGIRLVQTPVPELMQLRQPIGTWTDLTIEGSLTLDELRGQQLEIIAEFVPGTAIRFGFDLFMNETESTRVLYNTDTSQLILLRPPSNLDGNNPIALAPLQVEDGRIRLNLVVDRSSVEIFAGDGMVAMTGQIYAPSGSDGIALFADGGDVKLTKLEAYALDSIWSEAAVESAQAQLDNLCR